VFAAVVHFRGKRLDSAPDGCAAASIATTNRSAVQPLAHSLAIDQAGPQSERVDGLDNQREVARPVVAVAGEQADAASVAASH
jgi:hypothetical protein